ncbi:similar to Golgi transport protein GOT1 [Cyanidioschyzon merolae strain 10D]|jgi:hypothetical protein|uniref:Similar to Golgi transport protein GOT1 n=1 Tax=Cyanidioschyzon merolae (strain NIES-3377 / 10D) TaxID=280699 RepID=M1V7X8_CYAM1|nr:similar to Golgi transport protein GOT1 [Cyanidioschyzon merolae strain 10D]BAM80154.1 similar to Golgi transport protein GOT1 [Cyanidioschyzon merolae strain 10D]|eukprot:XP_005536440.1 similar to Golgi transport protein GOT1 [Cyanidioschyzon merolae strain 10D]
MNDYQKIGVTLSAISVLFYGLGVVLFFDTGLISIASVLFTSSLFFILGFKRAARFFFSRRKLRASALFFGGFGLVLLRWPVLGTLVQAVGALWLFLSFIPIAMTFLRQVPVLGQLVDTSIVRRILRRLSAASGYLETNGGIGFEPKLPV